jgi:cytochrome c556
LVDLEVLAISLADTSQAIPDAVAGISMAEVDRIGFAAQAQTLHDQALRLAESAALEDFEAVREYLNAIESTCNSCHERFRDFAGPLGG